MTIMRDAGVEFRTPIQQPRKNPTVDFDRLVTRDTLVNRPPGNLYGGLRTFQSIYHRFPVLAQFLP